MGWWERERKEAKGEIAAAVKVFKANMQERTRIQKD